MRINFNFHYPLVLIFATLLISCSSTNQFNNQTFLERITPYKPEIIQGNFVPQEALPHLQIGMHKSQVQTLLGTPLLVDLFNNDLWYYTFNINSKKTKALYSLNLTFANDFLSDIKHTQLPSIEDATKLLRPNPLRGKAVKQKLTAQEIDKLLSKNK